MPDEFVEMKKEGEKNIFVHPLAVENHKQLGWTVVDEEQKSAEAQTDSSTLDETASRKRSRKSE